MHLRSFSLFALCTAFAIAACAPNIAPTLPKSPERGEGFDGNQCSATQQLTQPHLMGWLPTERANLSNLRSFGVIAVRYSAKGCLAELEVLSHCIGESSKYEYRPYWANEKKVAKTQSELFAALPIGASRFSAEVTGERALRTDYLLAGMYTLPPSATFGRADLKGGDCSRATHVVGVMYVGAFAMATGEESEINAKASLFGFGAGGSSSSSMASLGEEGTFDACQKSRNSLTPDPGCSVPLRLSLMSLDENAGPSVAPLVSLVRRVVSGDEEKPNPSLPPAPPPASTGDDRDGDGIKDRDDACPEVKGVRSADASVHGCPLATPAPSEYPVHLAAPAKSLR
jgi:hypothetical protein